MRKHLFIYTSLQTSSSTNLGGNTPAEKGVLVTAYTGVCFPNFPFPFETVRQSLETRFLSSSAAPGKPV